VLDAVDVNIITGDAISFLKFLYAPGDSKSIAVQESAEEPCCLCVYCVYIFMLRAMGRQRAKAQCLWARM
jgi:hypothetical protein